MKRHIHSRFALAAAIAVLGGIEGIRGLNAQAQTAPSVKRTVLLKQDTTVAGREAVMAMVELPPGSTEGRHTHFAEVYGFVAEGALTLDIEGQPTRVVKTGEIFTVAPGQVHEGSNRSGAPVKLSVVFFAEKGKPLTTPAP
jgi:quercetin dioxygenase-like cupin family protein